MTREATLISLRWTARLLTLIPILAVVFITFEDAPHHYPWSRGIQPFLWSMPLYGAVIFLLMAWHWEGLGILSIPCFIGVYVAVILAKGLHANGLFVRLLHPGSAFSAFDRFEKNRKARIQTDHNKGRPAAGTKMKKARGVMRGSNAKLLWQCLGLRALRGKKICMPKACTGDTYRDARRVQPAAALGI
jgi:hypothetical protein